MHDEKFTRIIFRYVAAFDGRVYLIPREDVLQEIRIAQLTAEQHTVFRVASHNVYNLLCDYGFSRKKGKDAFDGKRLYDDSDSFLSVEAENQLRIIEFLYIKNDFTAAKLCDFFSVPLTNKIVKSLNRLFPKGGVRSGMTGSSVPYDEFLANKIIEKRLASQKTKRVWRHRNAIPGVYLKFL
jgi:hypothetical protein